MYANSIGIIKLFVSIAHAIAYLQRMTRKHRVEVRLNSQEHQILKEYN